MEADKGFYFYLCFQGVLRLRQAFWFKKRESINIFVMCPVHVEDENQSPKPKKCT
jgi:hypothetical protein